MVNNEAVRQGEEPQGRNCCLIIDQVCDTGRSDEEEISTATDNTKCRSKFKVIILGLGFSCIVICFIFATLGYTTKLRICHGHGNTKCEKDPRKFSQAQNYRLTAALLFIVGMCLIVGFVWLVKTDGRAQELRIRPDILVSDVTAEGLLKSPAPTLFHPISHVHNLVYESPLVEKLTSADDLPNYDTVVQLQKEGRSSVTPDGNIITIKGIPTESVGTQVDEDDINPPPSYLQALDLIYEVQEEVHF